MEYEVESMRTWEKGGLRLETNSPIIRDDAGCGGG